MHYTTTKKQGLLSLSALAVALTTSLSAYSAPPMGFDESKLPKKYIVKFTEDEAGGSSMQGNAFWGPRIAQESVLNR
ncbi:hypothetical protein CTH30272_03268 [Allocatenococcus thiocycli]|nr:hypothetical protein CTH30272_03268 [Catenococcus thiocycli]